MLPGRPLFSPFSEWIPPQDFKTRLQPLHFYAPCMSVLDDFPQTLSTSVYSLAERSMFYASLKEIRWAEGGQPNALAFFTASKISGS